MQGKKRHSEYFEVGKDLLSDLGGGGHGKPSGQWGLRGLERPSTTQTPVPRSVLELHSSGQRGVYLEAVRTLLCPHHHQLLTWQNK